MDRTLLICICVVALGLTGTACEKKSGGEESPKAKSAGTKKESDKEGSAEKEQAQKKAGDESDGRTINIESVGNEFKFKQTELEVKAGEKIHIVFKNTADQKSVKHNFLQLDTNKSELAKKVATAGLQAADNDYVPKGDVADHVIAHTPLAGPGETVEVTFTAPEEPGKYKYICTFPGHYPKMQGTLIVK